MPDGKIVALCGGVGGAKLALGLSRVVAPGDLTIIINTGDDWTHLGLEISPDIDTTTYTLAGLNDDERGWGLKGETWNFMAALKRLGGEDWFALGDHDLATHVERTRRKAAGETLSAITADFARRLGVAPTLIPMSDDPVRTIVETKDGPLAFQDYFVRQQAQPAVTALKYDRAREAHIAPAASEALASADLVIVCPSNPWLSIAPILEAGDMRARLTALRCPIIVVTPLIAGRAIKGPTAKLMGELGLEVSATSVARFYADIVDGYLLDETDAALAPEIEALGLKVATAQTLMTDLDEKVALAKAVIAFGRTLA